MKEMLTTDRTMKDKINKKRHIRRHAHVASKTVVELLKNTESRIQIVPREYVLFPRRKLYIMVIIRGDYEPVYHKLMSNRLVLLLFLSGIADDENLWYL